uniref:Uncharacterized protein n=1 Tax=Terrapene triunguis TaxID=2587831 RepID=A0A674I4V4_9SAUR
HHSVLGLSSNTSSSFPWQSPDGEAVMGRFNHLWQEQQGLALKAAELEQPEHSLVIEVAVEDVLPALENNKEQETLNQQLQRKGQELNEFWEKRNIHLMSEADKPVTSEVRWGWGVGERAWVPLSLYPIGT